MKVRKELKAECLYYVDYSLTVEDVIEAYENQFTLTGYVIKIDEEARVLKVVLGDGIIAELPWEESTIQPLVIKHPETTNVPDQVAYLKCKVIRIKVKAILGKKIILSRKDNMLEAWKEIVSKPKQHVFYGAYLNTNKSGTMIFYDIGEGITAACNIFEFTECRVDVKSWMKYSEIHELCISKLDKHEITVSRKKACKKTYEDFKTCDILNVKIGKPVYNPETNELEGYHVEVNARVDAIADLPQSKKKYKYGTIVRAAVRKVKPFRPKSEGGPTMSLEILDI